MLSFHHIATSRLLGFSLLAALVTTSALMTGALASFSSQNPFPAAVRPIALRPPDPSYGTLFVQVLLETHMKILGHLPQSYSPISGEGVSISSPGMPGQSPLVKITNSSGLVKVVLPATRHYVVTINDSRFHVEFPVLITTGMVNLVVRAHTLAYRLSFEELSDGQSSGWMTAGQRDYVAIETRGMKLDLKGTLFLELQRNSSRAGVVTNFDAGSGVDQIPIRVLNTFVMRDATLLIVEPLKDARVNGILRILVVTYVPTVEQE